MKRLHLFLPLVIVVVLLGFFAVMLLKIDKGEYDPKELPSTMLDRPVSFV